MSHSLTRRRFALLATITASKGLSLASDPKRIEITDRPAGVIRPELHGHFAEHLGSCIYGGIWVGRDSRIPNINGFRKQAVEDLKAVGIPVLRWPGGCFADDYHWRDGIGKKRPKTVNIHWGGYTEDNSFGTHEFVTFCRLIGAEPYFAGNMGSGSPEELRNWMEYCNYRGASSLAEERAANGAPEPFGVKYWGVGNENWGCGGQMTPEEYATNYRRFSTFLRGVGEARPFLIACGPNRNDLGWTRRYFDAMNHRLQSVGGYTMHFYSNGRNHATEFNAETAEEQLASFASLEKAIGEQRALLDQYDPDGQIGFMVDEWGVWDRMVPEEEKRLGRLWQQITTRSAVAAALGLNVFHRQASKLYMCNIAQMVNVLHALVLTDGAKYVRTSTYYAFEMMKPHRGGESLVVDNPDTQPLGLSVSASRKNGEVAITLVNPRHDGPMDVTCALSGVKRAAARILHDADLNACNTFEQPDRLVPRPHSVRVDSGALRIEVPPMSIVAVTAL